MTAPTVCTCLWFDSQAEEAARLYVSILPDARILHVHHQVREDGSKGPAFVVEFELQGQRFSAMNGGPHYKLSPAASIQVFVDTQAELDYIWSELLSGGTESRCGWLTDRFGLSWQIIPNALPKLLAKGGQTAQSVLRAMSLMVKLDIHTLENAARNSPAP